MKPVERRISDRHLLHLIKMWLDAPVEEDDGKGRKKRTTPNKDSGRGVPQGAPISPLLSNLYVRRFILGWKQRGLESTLRAKIVSAASVVTRKALGEEHRHVPILQRVSA